jgi:hypothetical protein
LPSVEACRHHREAAAWVVVEHQGHRSERPTIGPGRPNRPRHSEDGGGAAAHRFVDVGATVGATARQRRKQETGLHLPRVGGEPGDADAGDFCGVQVGVVSQ